MAQLPDISDEDKQEIARIEAKLKSIYDEETAMLEAHKSKKRELNEQLAEANRIALKNRQDVINADPELVALQNDLSQGVGA